MTHAYSKHGLTILLYATSFACEEHPNIVRRNTSKILEAPASYSAIISPFITLAGLSRLDHQVWCLAGIRVACGFESGLEHAGFFARLFIY